MRSTPPIAEPFAQMIAGVRQVLEPFAHLSDDDLRSSDLDPPMIRLQLRLRQVIRDWDESEARGG